MEEKKLTFVQKLDKVAQNSLYTTFTNTTTIDYSFNIFKRFISPGDSILELGPAEGLMTEKLIEIDPNLYTVEGSNDFAVLLQKKFSKLNVINSLFENLKIDRKFDVIVLGHVLEHVTNPQIVLNKVKELLKKDGKVLCAVPNAKSIHRQAAVEMGLISSVYEMSEKDIHHGHYRIYDPETLNTEFLKAGFEVIHRGGYWMKPLADSQIEKNWNQEMLDAFMKLGEFYPSISAEIYIVATLKDKNERNI